MIEIRHRKTRRLLRQVEADTLAGADLSGAQLSDADLRGQDLRGANLAGACLASADLRGADLRGADLRDANLCGADLRGADLRGTLPWGVQMAQVLYDRETKGLNPLMTFLNAGRKLGAPTEVTAAEAAEGRGDEVSSVG
jgi:Pentapeptide repeats (8 copies)